MKRLLIALIVILAILVGAAWYVLPRLPIVSGYAAKMTCSCYFLADRDLTSIKQEDLNFSLIRFANVSVVDDEQYATASIAGLARQTAVYRPGLGCTLVPKGKTRADLQAANYSPPPVQPAQPDTLAWPMGRQLADTLPEGIDRAAMQRAIQQHFDPDNVWKKKTRAIVVVYRDQIIAEHYAEGFDYQTPILGWSMTKSITNALIGIRHGQGYMPLDQPVDIPEWQQDDRRTITLHHLLQMSSGLAWEEVYDDIADATLMLYRSGDFFGYARSRPADVPPDSVWLYSSGTTNILSGLLRQTFNDQRAYWDFPRQALFNRIGMRSAIIETDAQGTFIGSSYCFATPRDWARLGLLYLHDGIWQGQRILPEGWVEYSTEPARQSEGQYGAQIWLNAGGTLPDAPRSMFSFHGFQGQRVYILPEQDLVVVRMGLSPEDTFDFNAMMRDILDQLPQKND